MIRNVQRRYPVMSQHGPAAQMAGLGCGPCGQPCGSCPSLGTCPKAAAKMGFLLADPSTDTSSSTDTGVLFTIGGIAVDWKLALLTIAVIYILYRMTAGSDSSKERRKQLKTAAAKYRAQVQKIKGAA